MRNVTAIVNPHSGGGSAASAWAGAGHRLRGLFPDLQVKMTAGPGTLDAPPATALAREALQDGAELIIAFGGDGTINEVVNGFFENGAPINREAALAVYNAGTGGDLRKTIGIEDAEDAFGRIARAEHRLIDVGKLDFTGDDGRRRSRLFVNIASFGLSGAVDRAINRTRISKLLGGRFAFLWASLWTGLRYRPRPVRITTDRGLDWTGAVGTAAVCNGRFFGGGMMMAPHADLSDGVFDVIVMHDTGPSDLFRNAGSLYDGSHLGNPKVFAVQATRVVAEPCDADDAVLIDLDGEAPGRLPATFEIAPKALKLIV